MKLEKTDKIISLAKNGAMLRKFVNERLPKVRQDKYGIIDRREGDVDKHEDGFYSNEDPCQSLSFRLCYKSFTGSFGCSSTYSDIAHIDKGLMEAYLLKYLNCHKDEILLEMAKMMLSDAMEQRDVALAEIDAMKSDLLTMFGCQKENLSASL